MSVVIRPLAENDIKQIAKFIAADKPAAARKWRDEILEACRMLGSLPDLGTGRDDLPDDLKVFPKGRYIVVFKRHSSGVVVIRILHGARDLPSLMR